MSAIPMSHTQQSIYPCPNNRKIRLCNNVIDRRRVSYVNDVSCLTHYMMNKIGNAGMAQIGNYSQLDNKTIVGNGQLMLDNQFGLMLRQKAIPVQTPCTLPSVVQDYFYYIKPDDLINLHCQQHPGIDIRHQCKNLGLTSKECDSSSGIFMRCLTDSNFAYLVNTQQIYYDCDTYSFWDHEGVFQKVECFNGEGLFQLKFFKWVNFPGIWLLYFAPDTPGIWVNLACDSCKLYLSTNIYTVRNNAGISFLENCGDLNELNWKILEHTTPVLIWECPNVKSVLYKDRLAEILHIVGIAKQHNINFTVEKAVFNVLSEEDVPLVPLTTKELLEEAERCDIEIPKSLIDDPYEVPASTSRFIPPDLPFFWEHGDSVLFFGLDQESMMLKLVKVLCVRTNILLLVPDSDKWRMSSLINGNDRLSMDSANILQEPQAFKRKLIDKRIRLVFFCIGKQEKLSEELLQGLRLCRKQRIATAFFMDKAEASELSADIKAIWLKSDRLDVVRAKDGFLVDTNDSVSKVTIDKKGGISKSGATENEIRDAKFRHSEEEYGEE